MEIFPAALRTFFEAQGVCALASLNRYDDEDDGQDHGDEEADDHEGV